MKNKTKLIIIVIGLVLIGVLIFFIVTKKPDNKTIGTSTTKNEKNTNVVGKSTSDYDYLLKNKPSAEKIANATTIDYRSLYKGANTLNGKFFNLTGEIVQNAGGHIFHVNMTKNGSEKYSYYTDRIQISVIGEPSEILMEGDIISFTGESLGNYTYTTVLGSGSTIPFLRVYAENLKVIGNTDK